MKALDQRGKISGLLLPLTLMSVLFVVTLILALWAVAGRADYKNNVDKKIAAAVKIAVQAESTRKDNEFVEKEKLPLSTYVGPEIYGKLSVSYPKKWNALVSDTGTSTTPLDAYFYSGVLPSAGAGTALVSASYSLRIQILSSGYDVAVKAYDGAAAAGKVKVTPYKPAKVASGTVGVRIDGTLANSKTGSMVILPLRDKTILIWTEDPQFVADFDKNILPSLTYVP